MARRTKVLECRSFYGRRSDYRGEAAIQGPLLVDIVVTQVTDGDRVCWPSYYVYIDSKHQCGGVAEHLPERWEDSSVGQIYSLVPR